MARVTFAPIHCDVPVFVTKSGLAFYLQKINDLGNSFYMYICWINIFPNNFMTWSVPLWWTTEVWPPALAKTGKLLCVFRLFSTILPQQIFVVLLIMFEGEEGKTAVQKVNKKIITFIKSEYFYLLHIVCSNSVN